MTRKLTCATGGCGGSPVITKPVPLCARCGLEAATQIISGTLQNALATARRDASALTAPPPVRMPPTEAYRLADERLAALKARGVERVVFRHVKDVIVVTGKSRGWVYAWLNQRAKDGILVRDDRDGQAGWRFAA